MSALSSKILDLIRDFLAKNTGDLPEEILRFLENIGNNNLDITELNMFMHDIKEEIEMRNSILLIASTLSDSCFKQPKNNNKNNKNKNKKNNKEKYAEIVNKSVTPVTTVTPTVKSVTPTVTTIKPVTPTISDTRSVVDIANGVIISFLLFLKNAIIKHRKLNDIQKRSTKVVFVDFDQQIEKLFAIVGSQKSTQGFGKGLTLGNTNNHDVYDVVPLICFDYETGLPILYVSKTGKISASYIPLNLTTEFTFKFKEDFGNLMPKFLLEILSYAFIPNNDVPGKEYFAYDQRKELGISMVDEMMKFNDFLDSELYSEYCAKK